MSDQIVIGVKDKETADKLQREFASLGIQTHRHNQQQVISFGATIAWGPVKSTFTITEFLELVKGIGPAAIDGFCATVRAFGNQVQLFVNGKPKQLDDVDPTVFQKGSSLSQLIEDAGKSDPFEDLKRMVR